MNRITPEQVLEAYRVTGLRPERGHAYPVDGKCCGYGAVRRWSESFADSFSASYWCGFFDGFDDAPEDAQVGEYSDGYADGKACAAAVFGGAK